MRDLNYQIKGLCNRFREGSYATQASRRRCLDLIATQIHDLGFRHLSVNGLKSKHILALVNFWKQENLSASTIKNRMAYLRWWAEKINKPGIIPSSNTDLDIPARSYVSNTSRAVELTNNNLDRISDLFVKLSLQLQAAFGLRREESIKFIVSWADKGTSISLKGSWCKGGHPREVPITNDLQRTLLDEAHKLAGSNSLIPSHRSYIQHLRVYESQCLRAGLHKLHGLRHFYAQSRYLQLTGLPSPAIAYSSNLLIAQLSQEQKLLHKQARLTISEELGHHRLSVTSVYLGSPYS